MKEKNVVIIGAGVVGLSAAIAAMARGLDVTAVSYTHLTLPTICSV